MRKGDNPNLLGLYLIDDAVREAPQRKATRGPAPDWAKARIGAQDAESALELSDERQSELSVCFSRVEAEEITSGHHERVR